jgi:hypothetical protein
MGILMKEPYFDIYPGAPEPDKEAIWLASVEGRSNAPEQMGQIQYFIFNPETFSILAHRDTFNKREESSKLIPWKLTPS